MSDWKKSFLPAVVVVGAIAAFVGGNNVRALQDTGKAVRVVPQSYLAGIEFPADSPRQVPEGDLFYQLLLLLERDYVDPNIDEDKLAYGAVKGMIAGLWDPLSQYMAKDHYDDYQRKLSGTFAGAGVELRALADPVELKKARKNARSADPLLLYPVLEVAMVAPGSPAQEVGLAVGDRILSVNGRWVMGYTDVQRIRQLQQDVSDGKAPAEELKKLRTEYQKKVRSAIPVARVEDILTLGDGKQVELEWTRAGKTLHGTLTTVETRVPAVSKAPDGTIVLHVFRGAAGELAKLGVPDGESTLDLRQSSLGDSAEIKPLLELLAPAGTFGQIVTDKPGQPRTLTTSKGTTSAHHYTLLVDRSTRGAAEVLALALKARGLGNLVGGPMAGEAAWIETASLADGSGYTLNTGKFMSGTVEAMK